MKSIIFFMSTLMVVNAATFFDVINEEWRLFKVQNNKTYDSDTEETYRMKIFIDNRHRIIRHNLKYERGRVPFKLGINKYSDYFQTEFSNILNGYNKTSHVLRNQSLRKPQRGSSFIYPANVVLPDYVNWVTQGAVTPVKDQGQCGSCWAFSATGSLEGQHFRKTGVLISLSEQNLIDCSTDEGNNGCEGGLMDWAFNYVRSNNGIDTERSYPYEGKDAKCRYSPKNSGATDTGFVDITVGSEEELKAAVATIGPVSVAIDASQPTFHMYKSGVYVEPDCKNGPEDLDHGVLVVGYGTDETTKLDYWLVKNSWGDTWGEEGYIKMARNADNQCGIATSASYPLE